MFQPALQSQLAVVIDALDGTQLRSTANDPRPPSCMYKERTITSVLVTMLCHAPPSQHRASHCRASHMRRFSSPLALATAPSVPAMQESTVACDALPRVKNKACRSMAWSEMAEMCHAGLLQPLSCPYKNRPVLLVYCPGLISGSPTHVSRPSSSVNDTAKVHRHSSAFKPEHVRETRVVHSALISYPDTASLQLLQRQTASHITRPAKPPCVTGKSSSSPAATRSCASRATATTPETTPCIVAAGSRSCKTAGTKTGHAMDARHSIRHSSSPRVEVKVKVSSYPRCPPRTHPVGSQH